MWVGLELNTLCASANEDSDSLVNNAPPTEITSLNAGLRMDGLPALQHFTEFMGHSNRRIRTECWWQHQATSSKAPTFIGHNPCNN